MAKKMISLVYKEIIIVIVLVLCTILFLNICTLIAINRIESGVLVKNGFASAIVSSGSMEPSLSKNDLIIIKSKSKYSEGDIITFVSDSGSLITHRIVSLSDGGVITQGDANNTPDGETERQRILGEVIFAIPGIGIVVNLLLTPIGIATIIVFPVGATLIAHLARKIRSDKEVKIWKKEIS